MKEHMQNLLHHWILLPRNKTQTSKCDFWHCKISCGFCKFGRSDLLRKFSFVLLSIRQSLLKCGLISQALKERYLTQALHILQLFALFVWMGRIFEKAWDAKSWKEVGYLKNGLASLRLKTTVSLTCTFQPCKKEM